MKLVQSLIVVAALAIPAASAFAQSNEVVAPTHVQATQSSVNASGAATDLGGIADGSSASGGHHELRSFDAAVAHLGHKIQGSIRPDPNDGIKPVFFGGA
ncbi:hypothetical protein [Paraburkholderia aromaticivorans]|jgi:hypothetical protein